MINIKTAMTSIAAAAVVVVTAKETLARTRKTNKSVPVPTTIVNTISSDLDVHFATATETQAEISNRILNGYYDDKDDLDIDNDYRIIYNNILYSKQ